MSQLVQAILNQPNFRYTPLNHNEQCIRVFKICQESESINLQLRHTSDLSQHIAISYRWSSPETNRTIHVDGEPFEVCGNLFDLLVELKRKQIHDDFWVDAISIDQSHTRERNHQVQQMHQIYAKARMTFFWLGRGDPDTISALDFLEQIATAHGGLARVPNGNFHGKFSSQAIKTAEVCVAAIFKHPNVQKKIEHAFERICTNECFSRTWIFQEIVLSLRRFLLIGSHMISWDMFWNLLEGISDTQSLSDAVFSVPGSNNMCFQSLCHFFVKNPSINLMKLMLATEESQCSDIRDKVYALNGVLQSLGIWSPEVDYAKWPADLFLEILWQVDNSWNKGYSTFSSGENESMRECDASKFHHLCRMLKLKHTDIALENLTTSMSAVQLEKINNLRFRLRLERQCSQLSQRRSSNTIERFLITDLHDSSGTWYCELLVLEDGSCFITERYSEPRFRLNCSIDRFNHDHVIDALLTWTDMTTILMFTRKKDASFAVQNVSLFNQANLREDGIRYRSLMMKNKALERPRVKRVDSEQLYRNLGI